MQLALPVRPDVGARSVEVDGGSQVEATKPACKRNVLADEGRFSSVLCAGVVQGSGPSVARGDEEADSLQARGERHRVVRLPRLPVGGGRSPEIVGVAATERDDPAYQVGVGE